MFLQVHAPAPPLGRFVESITFYEGLETSHSRQKLLPDGIVHICIDLGETPKRRYESTDPRRYSEFRNSWISGAHDRWMVIEAQQGASMLVIAFHPGGAYPFLRFPLEGLTNLVVPLEDLLATAAVSLRDRILEAPTPAAKIDAAERWLYGRCGSSLEADPLVAHMARRLAAPGRLRIAEAVGETGYSERHVSGIFRRWIGVAPKSYQRLRRFARIRRLLAMPDLAAKHPDWPDLAAAFGYVDQSHLIRDFHRFAGLTPGGYAEAARGIDNYLPVADA